jgi:hypothetical protein
MSAMNSRRWMWITMRPSQGGMPMREGGYHAFIAWSVTFGGQSLSANSNVRRCDAPRPLLRCMSPLLGRNAKVGKGAQSSLHVTRTTGARAPLPTLQT